MILELVSYYNSIEKKQRYFINIAGLGFESVVVKKNQYSERQGTKRQTDLFL